jgi:hypothetical protein
MDLTLNASKQDVQRPLAQRRLPTKFDRPGRLGWVRPGSNRRRLGHLRRFPGLQQGSQKRLVAFDQPRLARGTAQLLQLEDQTFGIRRLLLQTLKELQAPDKPKPLRFDFGRPRPASVLRVETAYPGLVKHGRFTQEPLV